MSKRLTSIENWQRAGFGIYVHWPYCAAKCPYCDFNSHVVASIDHDDWMDAYLQELDRYGAELPGRVVSSVFFGGGTPSLMKPGVVGAVLDRISKLWSVSNDVEITLEANPTSVEAEKFHEFRLAGVNRVSIGVQALNDADLKALGRMHTADEALNAVDVARRSFDRMSFDLIYARQNQSLDDWQAELSFALSLEPSHLSLYQLTIEPGTVFAKRHAQRLLKGLPDEDLSADLFELTQDVCTERGLRAYEVSNHAKPGDESQHNQIYWNSGDFLGLGPGGHGRITRGDERVATETPLLPKDWLTSVSNGSGESNRMLLSRKETATEKLIMGLRLSKGIHLDSELNRIIDSSALKRLCQDGLIIVDKDQIYTTFSGRMLLNTLLQDLIR